MVSYTSSGTTTGDPWPYWTGHTAATTSAITTDAVWSCWVSCSTTTATGHYNSVSPAREVTGQREREEYKRKERLKEEKARQLLKEVLTEEQNNQLDKDGYFELTAIKSGNTYRINKGRSRNILQLNKDRKVVKTMCFHPEENVHNYDTMAAQKLMLEYDEEEVRKIANYS